ncbi:MAG: hypothetical protein P8K81_07275, partial [Flavobacteriales bacterium]|nr:hypothetical protein [Flavobacteriales bacterium]
VVAVVVVGIAVGRMVVVDVVRLFMRRMNLFRIVVFVESVFPFAVPIRLGMHAAYWRTKHHGNQYKKGKQQAIHENQFVRIRRKSNQLNSVYIGE